MLKAVDMLNKLLKAGFTETFVAERCGCSRQTVNRLKNRVHKNVSEDTYIALYDMLADLESNKIEPERG